MVSFWRPTHRAGNEAASGTAGGFIYALVALVAVISLSLTSLTSCTTVERVVENVVYYDTTIVYQPRTIRDTITAVRTDTVVTAIRVRGSDTVVRVRYYPLRDTVTIEAVPERDTIRVMDTIRVVQSAEKGGWDEMPLWAYIVGVALILSLWYLRKKS